MTTPTFYASKDKGPKQDIMRSVSSKPFVYEVLEKLGTFTSVDTAIAHLRENSSPALLAVLKGNFDQEIVWLLPKDADPPYTPNPEPPSLVATNLHTEVKRFYLFVNTGVAFGQTGENFSQKARELQFLRLLESLPAPEAKIMVAVISKSLQKLYPNLTRELVQAAFPNLIGPTGWVDETRKKLIAARKIDPNKNTKTGNAMTAIDRQVLQGFKPFDNTSPEDENF